MLFDLIIPAAYAQDAAAAAAAAAPSPLSGMLPLVFIFGVFYLLLIRPQQKKMKLHQAMIAAVKRGDEVITGGGIHGKITKVEEGGLLKVQIAEGVEVTVDQSTVSTVLTKPDATEAAKKADDKVVKKSKVANDNK